MYDFVGLWNYKSQYKDVTCSSTNKQRVYLSIFCAALDRKVSATPGGWESTAADTTPASL